MKSEQIGAICTALAKFQGSVPPIKLDKEVAVKTRTGGTYKFKYASFGNILNTIRKPLSESELSFTQLVSEAKLTTVLMHSSGEWLSSEMNIHVSNNPQEVGSSITYAKRYSLCAILGISGDDDDDGNIAAGNTPQVKKKPVPKKPKLTDEVFNTYMAKMLKGGKDKEGTIITPQWFASKVGLTKDQKTQLEEFVKENS